MTRKKKTKKMTVKKAKNERMSWFLKRVGKRIFRSETSCSCEMCSHVRQRGLVVVNGIHADYLCNIEAEYNIDGDPLRYFDTLDEVAEFEKNNSYS
jgi:hypothetical protein